MVLPFCVVGHVNSWNRQFIRTKGFLLNKLQRMICNHLLITNPTSSRDIISSLVRLVDVLSCEMRWQTCYLTEFCVAAGMIWLIFPFGAHHSCMESSDGALFWWMHSRYLRRWRRVMIAPESLKDDGGRKRGQIKWSEREASVGSLRLPEMFLRRDWRRGKRDLFLVIFGEDRFRG
jgi:hypothetical protein